MRVDLTAQIESWYWYCVRFLVAVYSSFNHQTCHLCGICWQRVTRWYPHTRPHKLLKAFNIWRYEGHQWYQYSHHSPHIQCCIVLPVRSRVVRCWGLIVVGGYGRCMTSSRVCSYSWRFPTLWLLALRLLPRCQLVLSIALHYRGAREVTCK